eukprot:2724871-Rhodomonas_salina.1
MLDTSLLADDPNAESGRVLSSELEDAFLAVQPPLAESCEEQLVTELLADSHTRAPSEQGPCTECPCWYSKYTQCTSTRNEHDRLVRDRSR